MKKTENKISHKKVFIFSFLIILLCWLPYILRFFPGLLSPDSLFEVGTILNGFSSVSNHHPIIHTLFIAGPYNIGYAIFQSIDAGIFFATITQVLIMASIFAYLITFLHKRNVNKIVLLIILLFYAIVPMHGYYSITMWKDIIFAGLLLLLTTQIVKIIEKSNGCKIKLKNLIGFTIISILCVFFRNNAIYMYMLLALITLIIFRKNIKPFIIVFLIVFGIYYFVNGPVFSWCNVTKSSSAEYIGMPLQQIGRMAYKNIDFTEEEKEKLNKLMDLEIMAQSYNPRVSDGIKFNENYNSEVFDQNKLEYAKLWLSLVLKHPAVAFESYAVSTLGYWYPGIEHWTVANDISENNYGLEINSLVPEIMEKGISYVENRQTPILNIEWSIGLAFWVIFIFASACKKKLGRKYLLIYVPVFGVWVTMMLASPVFGEFRYVYGAFTCLPLLMVAPYLNFETNKVESKEIEKENERGEENG